MVDMTDPGFVADPYPVYAGLHASGPVHRVALADGTKAWLVTGYAEVRAALSDPRLVMTKPEGTAWRGLSLPPGLGITVANSDPPVHTRLRKLLTTAFTQRRVAELGPAIQRFADELLDRVAGQGGCDLVAAFARPLPIRVFRELFGIPDEDGDEVFGLAGKIFMPNSADRQHRAAAMVSMQSYLGDLIRRKQRDPGGDLLTALIRARDVDERLTEDELTGMVAVLMSAGSQTTTHLISNSVISLFRTPGLAATLTAQPDLVPAAVEEVLRHEGPVPVSSRRFATEDLTIEDTRISPGEPVLLALGAANRDPGVYPDAGRFECGRPDPHRHMAFGHGIHHCVGAALARLEGTIALATVLRKLPGLAPAMPVGELRWQDYLSIRGVYELPVTWGGR